MFTEMATFPGVKFTTRAVADEKKHGNLALHRVVLDGEGLEEQQAAWSLKYLSARRHAAVDLAWTRCRHARTCTRSTGRGR